MADDADKPEHKDKDDQGSSSNDDGGQSKSSNKKKDADQDEGDPDEDDDPDGDDQDDDDGKPPLYKRPIFWIVTGIVLLVLAVAGLLYWLHARKYVSTDDAFVDAHIVRIAAQVQGQLTRVPDLDNRHINQGQLLAVIESGTYATQLQQAQAQVSQADAQIAQAQAQVISARASERQAAANAVGPAAQALYAAHDYQRYATLQRLDRQAAAATQVEQARTNADNTAAQALAAQKQVDTAAANVLSAEKQVKAARAQRAAAEAQVAQAQVVTSYLRIVAPINGQVVNRSVDNGSYVSVGQQMMAIVPDDQWVTANFKETQLKLMRPGQPVTMKIDAYPQVVFHGHVDSIQHGAGQAFQLLPPQNATGNYVKVVQRVPVRILFDGAEWRQYAVGPGMSVVPTVKVR
jgi:membrane fusion protein (multidrug efflux system)